MQHADTVGEALRTLVAHPSLHDWAVVPALTLSDGTALLTFAAEDIAGLLAMHRRTRSRRLHEGGVGFRTLANENRFDIARQLLEDTEVPLGHIAAALGYSEASAFTRAFRRWSGQTPPHGGRMVPHTATRAQPMSSRGKTAELVR